jgi:hypothetical protein
LASLEDDLLDDGGLGDAGGVDDLSAGGDGEGADLAAGIAGIAVHDLFLEHGDVNEFAAGTELIGAASGALDGGGVEIEFQFGVGEHDRSLVAAFGDEVGAGGADFLLLADEEFADGGDEGDEGGSAGGITGAEEVADGFTVEEDAGRLDGKVEDDFGEPGDVGKLARVFEVGVAAEGGEADRAVHRTGVEEIEAEFLGDGLSHRGFPGSGGAVDGDDHTILFPCFARISCGNVLGLQAGLRRREPKKKYHRDGNVGGSRARSAALD